MKQFWHCLDNYDNSFLEKDYSLSKGGPAMNTPSKQHTGAGPAHQLTPPADAAQNNWIVIGTTCSVLLSVALAVSFLMPFLTAAALAPFFYQAIKRGDVRAAFNYALRWGVILFLCVSVLAIYLPDRTAGSIPLAERCIGTMGAWVNGVEAPVPFGPVTILVGLAGIALASIFSGGLGAIIIGAGTLGCAACTFTFLVRHGENILQMAVIGNPPWIIAFCAAGLFLLVPTALPFYRRLLGTMLPEERDEAYAKTHALIGASLVLVSIAFAILLDNTWQQVLSDYTVW